jgi:hypothetical protein
MLRANHLSNEIQAGNEGRNALGSGPRLVVSLCQRSLFTHRTIDWRGVHSEHAERERGLVSPLWAYRLGLHCLGLYRPGLYRLGLHRLGLHHLGLHRLPCIRGTELSWWRHFRHLLCAHRLGLRRLPCIYGSDLCWGWHLRHLLHRRVEVGIDGLTADWCEKNLLSVGVSDGGVGTNGFALLFRGSKGQRKAWAHAFSGRCSTCPCLELGLTVFGAPRRTGT